MEPAVGLVAGLGDRRLAELGDLARAFVGLLGLAHRGQRVGEVDAGIGALVFGERLAVKRARLSQRHRALRRRGCAPPQLLVHTAEQTERLLVGVGRFLPQRIEHLARGRERARLREGDSELLLQQGVGAEAPQAVARHINGGEELAGRDGRAGGLLVFEHVAR